MAPEPVDGGRILPLARGKTVNKNAQRRPQSSAMEA